MNPLHVDITDRTMLDRLLNRLSSGAQPLWGRMTAQGMVEHLVESVECTNGKRTVALPRSAEQALKEKWSKVTIAFEIPRNAEGALSSIIGRERCQTLGEALALLNRELDEFERYFSVSGRTAVHGTFGPMNHREWVLWHGKHLGHHFRQFGMMETAG